MTIPQEEEKLRQRCSKGNRGAGVGREMSGANNAEPALARSKEKIRTCKYLTCVNANQGEN